MRFKITHAPINRIQGGALTNVEIDSVEAAWLKVQGLMNGDAQ